MARAQPAFSDAGVTAWRRAEASVGDARASAAAAQELPPRQGLILRAIDALHRGSAADLAQVEADATQAKEHDLAALLSVLREREPSELDPSQVRARAKDLGVENPTRLPRLDLLRLTACRLAGQRAQRPPALAEGARRDLFLDQLCPVLQRLKKLRYYKDASRSLSPRFLAVLQTLVTYEVGRPDAATVAARQVPEVDLGITPEGWPDLGRGGAFSPLARWLADPRLPAWRQSLEADLGAVASLARGPRLGFVRALLARARELLLAARAREALEVLDLTCKLLGDVPADRAAFEVLRRHVERERLKLRALASEDLAPRETLVHLWKRVRTQGPGERAAAADFLMRRGLPYDADEVREAFLAPMEAADLDGILHATAQGPFAGLFEPAQLEALLPAAMPPARRAAVRALHHAARAEPAPALEQATRLLRAAAEAPDEEVAAAERVVRKVLRGVVRHEDAGKATQRALDELVRAVAQSRPSCGFLLELAGTLFATQEPGRSTSRIEYLRRAAASALDPARALRDEELREAIALASMFRERRREQELFRGLGRLLRRLPPVAADMLALRAIGSWYEGAEHSVDLVEPLPERVAALTAFVLRDGEDALLARVLERFHVLQREERQALLRWYEEQDELESELWLELVDSHLPAGLAGLPPDLRELLEQMM